MPQRAATLPTLAIIGCGNMCTAILAGLLKASNHSSPIFGRFIACVHTSQSAERLKATLKPHAGKVTLEIKWDSNVSAAEESDIVMLGCKPYMCEEIFGEPGFFEALDGKLLISVVGGMTPEKLTDLWEVSAQDPKKSVKQEGAYFSFNAFSNQVSIEKSAETARNQGVALSSVETLFRKGTEVVLREIPPEQALFENKKLSASTEELGSASYKLKPGITGQVLGFMNKSTFDQYISLSPEKRDAYLKSLNNSQLDPVQAQGSFKQNPQELIGMLPLVRWKIGKDKKDLLYSKPRIGDNLNGVNVLSLTVKHPSPPLIIRAIPNIAAAANESMTEIQTTSPPLPSHLQTLVTRTFEAVGATMMIPPRLINTAALLGGSTPALAALFLEGLIDGGVRKGLKRSDATIMAVQAVKGACVLVEEGLHPAVLQEQVSSPGGCTIHALSVLERAAFRGTVGQAVVEGIDAAAKLGEQK